MPAVDVDAIAALVREAALTEVLPRFRTLSADDIKSKPSVEDPDDIVTTADRYAEAWLTPRLQSALPGVVVVGEEAAARTPSLVDQLGSAPLAFVVDPVDGTKNFAAGSVEFAVMVALLQTGTPVASWIYLPAKDEMFAAEAGSGARLNGMPLNPLATPTAWRGTLHIRHLPEELRRHVPAWYARLATHIPPVGCGAVEYTDVARGRKHFSTFYRLNPWDHLPGALIVREAGGAVRHLDGREYSLASGDDLTIAANDAAQWPRLMREVFGARA